MVVLLVAGIAATGWQAIRATAEKQRATVEKHRALEAEALAEERLKEAEAISNFLTGMIGTSQPEGEGGGSRIITFKEALKSAEQRLASDQTIPSERRAILQKAIDEFNDALGSQNSEIAMRESAVQFYTETYGPEHFNIRRILMRGYSPAMLMGKERSTLSIEKDVLDEAFNQGPQSVVPFFKDMPSDDRQVEAARQMLLNWDFKLDKDSVEAGIYVAFERQLDENIEAVDNHGYRIGVVKENIVVGNGTLAVAVGTPASRPQNV